MRIRSIGARLTIWYTSLLTLTFLFLGGTAYGLLAYSLSRDMDTALNGVAEVLVQRARVEGSAVVPSDIDELFRRFFGFSPLDRHIEMFDPLGRRYPRQPPSRSNQLPLSPEALKNASQGLPTFETVASTGPYPARVLTMPVMRAGRVINLVQVGMSLENMYKTRRRFLLIMAAVLPFGLLLAGGGGWLLARRALKPVDRMTQAARRISGEHLDERLQETGSGDELDRLAKTLNDMLRRLDDAFHQMRQFSADASHELQTPLTILKGEMEVALRSQRSPEEYQGVLKSGLEEIDRINHLVDGLLLLARADAGVLRLDLRPVELKELVQEICDQMKLVADDHSISLHPSVLETVSVLADQEHLRRLLLNLVDNAIKYTPAGGNVTLSLQSEKDWVALRISDTGIGLSKDEQQLIFSRFHRATETRSRDEKGVGLGLSIARSIAEAHGGKIQVESTPGQGSTFTVLLPQIRSSGTNA
ncbi:MAG: ATP-binding protein [Syntrophobacterales bacterium]|jgi:heavy metal sensor kinase